MIGMPSDKEREYYQLISKIESGNNPKAKNPRSTASGRFQFIKSTWIGLGYDWKDVFNDKLQWEAIKKFTGRNAAQLAAAGCAINFATLYGAHFLGATGFLRIMRASPDDPISVATSPAQRKANPTILHGSVRDFCTWLEEKTGDSVYKRYTTGGAPEEGQVPDQRIPVDPIGSRETGSFAPVVLLGFFILVVLIGALILGGN